MIYACFEETSRPTVHATRPPGALPGPSGVPVRFLMYSQAETADGRLDCLNPDNFRYEIVSKEITA